MKRIGILILLTAVLACLTVVPAAGQTYYFSIDTEVVDVFWQADGTVDLDYRMVLTNSSGADPIDYVDIGLPTEDYDLSAAQAWIDGQSLSDISQSPYVSGIAVGLGSGAIRPGGSGTLTVSIDGVRGVMYQGSDSGMVSVNFSPTWFGSEYVYGATDLTVNFHLPPGIAPEEPRWHAAPSGFPSEPATGLDEEGRVVYQWRNPDARADTQYVFGASFPAPYVDSSAVITPTLFQRLGIDEETFFAVLCCGGVVGLFALIIGVAVAAGQRRKLAYLPPKIAIEGHGVKRGLTAVEAAVLLQTPLDRVMTMVLFSTIKKGGARVVQENPLRVEAIEPPAQELHDYETAFVQAIVLGNLRERSRKLQTVMVDLVKAVQLKMKGFSLRETRDYYKAVMEKAWQEVEQANTPEVKSERFAESIEWTMLDRNFDDRTERTFRTGPVYLPMWWGGFSPAHAASSGAGRMAKGAPVSMPRPTGGGRTATSPSLPTLPGANFAASVVKGIQNTAGNLVSNVAAFTGNVTKVTNPPPPPSTISRGGGGWSGGGGGHSCACACACAGCACACAGGGR
jgi:hypothetical protein